MQINANYYTQTQTKTQDTTQTEALTSYMNSSEESKYKAAGDSVQLSDEAYAALKEYAPEALSALGYNDNNPVLDEMQEIAREQYFHFGTNYAEIPPTEEGMLSALEVANRYMDALNSITPDDIYDSIAGANTEGADSSLGMVDIHSARTYITA